MIVQIIYTINYCILLYFLIISFCYTTLLIASVPDVIGKFKELFFGEIFPIEQSINTTPVTVIMPTYNEENDIINAVQSALNSTYKNLEIIIINDGSTDRTFEVLNEKYQLQPINDFALPNHIKTAKMKQIYVSKTHPNLSVINKEHSGAGDSINMGINASTAPLFITLDADSMFEPNTIPRLVYQMLSTPHTIAVGGSVYILNDCKISEGKITQLTLPKQYITRIQACEYIRSFIFGRSGWNLFKGALSYSGTCSLFERDAVIEIGGFDTQNPAQDAEIIAHLHSYMREKKYPYSISFTPVAFAWTTVPDDLKSYTHQRIQWQWGLLRSFLSYVKMLFNPRYGITGLFSYPFYILVEGLGHFVELLAYLMIIISWIFSCFDVKATLIFFLLSSGFIVFLTVATMLINIITFNQYRKISDTFLLFLYPLLEMFGFRQYSVIVRTLGTIKYFFVGLKKKPQKF